MVPSSWGSVQSGPLSGLWLLFPLHESRWRDPRLCSVCSSSLPGWPQGQLQKDNSTPAPPSLCHGQHPLSHSFVHSCTLSIVLCLFHCLFTPICIGMDSGILVLQQFIIIYSSQLSYCSNCPRFGQWRPIRGVLVSFAWDPVIFLMLFLLGFKRMPAVPPLPRGLPPALFHIRTSHLHGEGTGGTIHVKQFRGTSPTAHKTADGKVCVRSVPARPLRARSVHRPAFEVQTLPLLSEWGHMVWEGGGHGLPIIKSELLSMRERTESHLVLTPVCSLYVVCFRLSEPGFAEGRGGKDLGFAAGDGTFLARSLPFKVPSSCRLLGQCGLWAGLLEPPRRGLVL